MAPELHSPRVNWVKLAAVKRFLSLAEITKKREPAQLVVGGKYRVGKKISNGAFGQLRLVTDVITGDDLAIKLEPENAKIPQLFLEFEFYKRLGPYHALPRVHYYGKCGRYNALVLDLLGPNLEELFTLCGRRFSTKTILMIGLQLLTRMEKIHSKGLIFRDMKPENVLIGRKSQGKENILHIIDYGLSKPYIDTETRKHITCTENRPITGTIRYMSVNAHFGMEQSRRDDMEALGYLIIYFLKGGKLPWMGYREENMRERFRKIGLSKQHINITNFCRELPREVAIYLRYVRSLRFTEPPDYNYLRSLLRSCLMARDQVEDDIFDWMTQSSFCSSPYLDHPPKAAMVLGTFGSVRCRSQGQDLGSLHETRRSRSWNVDMIGSSAGVISGSLSSPLVSDIQSNTEQDTKTSQSTVILRTEVASEVQTQRQPSAQSPRMVSEVQQPPRLASDSNQPVTCSCFTFLKHFKFKL